MKRGGLATKQILIIDDDRGILTALRYMLEDAGYRVHIGDRIDALFKLRYRPDLILLDYLLTGENGKDVTERLKKEKRTQKIPIIVMSGDPEVKRAALAAGADGFIEKPCGIDTLYSVIHRVLSRNTLRVSHV